MASRKKGRPGRRRGTSRKPKWIIGGANLDEMAQRRCLMILSVLSGEKSVEDVAREGQISPAQYYQFEKKALTAMVAALVPGAGATGSPAPAMKQMERRILELERAKRRLERLLHLTRLAVAPGPMTQPGRRRPKKPRKARQLSTAIGLTPWIPKKRAKASKADDPTSIPTAAGEAASSAGTGS